MKIAYVYSGIQLPFVVNELEAHDTAGCQVLSLISRHQDDCRNLSQLMIKWHKKSLYRPAIYREIWNCFREVSRHPIRFLKASLWLLGLSLVSPRDFVLGLYEMLAACSFAQPCRRHGVDHIHVHFASRSLTMGILLGFLLGKNVSCTVHAFDIFMRKPGTLRKRLSCCRFIVAISEYNVRYLQDKCGSGIADLCTVIHCGIHIGGFLPRHADFSPHRIVSVARLVAKKGLDIAIRACEKLARKGIPFFFEIIGDGEEYHRLDNLIRQCHLEGTVRLLGAVPNDEIAQSLRNAALFLLPCVAGSDGNVDGIPVSIMEAMACEVPVISSRLSGIPELVIDGETGFSLKEKDVDEIADRIEQLLNDRETNERLGRSARRLVLEQFDIEKNAARIRSLFEKNRKSERMNAKPTRTG